MGLSDDRRAIYASLDFKNGQTYCCLELTCHFKPDWERIRLRAREAGLPLGHPLCIDVAVTVEAGALTTAYPSGGTSYRYTERFHEEPRS